MKIKRSLFKNLRVVLDFSLRQLKVVRFICGGVWYKQEGTWHQAFSFADAGDGSMYLTTRYKDLTGASHRASFHETNSGIEAIEKYQ